MSFSAMKKNRGKSFDKLNEQLQKMGSNSNSGGDDDYWKLEVDKAGNGFAIIRFLPAPEDEDFATVKVFDHGFQGPGGWYIEKSLTTLDKDDPVSEYNSELWNSGIDANKEIARKQKRRLSFHSNIYVVKDPANPSNNGKVFKYKYGKKIFDKLNEAMNPGEFEQDQRFNPFDMFDGANFRLKAKNGDGGFRTYEGSTFDRPGPMTDAAGDELTEEVMQDIYENQMFSLKEIVDPKNFKSYDELKARLRKVLKLDEEASHAPQSQSDDDGEMEFTPRFKERKAPEKDQTPSPSSAEDEDDDMSFFADLADDD